MAESSHSESLNRLLYVPTLSLLYLLLIALWLFTSVAAIASPLSLFLPSHPPLSVFPPPPASPPWALAPLLPPHLFLGPHRLLGAVLGQPPRWVLPFFFLAFFFSSFPQPMLPSASDLACRREERVQKAFSVDHHGPGNARLSHRAVAPGGE